MRTERGCVEARSIDAQITGCSIVWEGEGAYGKLVVVKITERAKLSQRLVGPRRLRCRINAHGPLAIKPLVVWL